MASSRSSKVAPVRSEKSRELREVPSKDAQSELERFNHFYDHHAQFVARSLRRLGIDQDLLDDALQEVFVVVHRRLPEHDGTQNAKTWLFRITMNVASNLRRQTQRWHRKLSGGSAAIPESLAGNAQDQLSEVIRDENLRLLYRVLDTLDEGKRHVFMLHELEQMTMPDVADALELNLNTAYSRLRAARDDFERSLQKLTHAEMDTP